ncbi:DEAD/DEAH box helicase family protein [Vibrio harveyi]
MNLRELIRDKRTSIDEEAAQTVDIKGYNSNLRALKRFSFWKNNSGAASLWEHQEAAVMTMVAYLNSSDKISRNKMGSALLKLPTGTGKSGIISVLSRCLPKYRNILVLTPREALTKQLLDDIRFRFWNHMGFTAAQSGCFSASASELGATLEKAECHQLLPSEVNRINEILKIGGKARKILVGTHQSLGQICRVSALNENGNGDSCSRFLTHIEDNFDLIIVDEGHYEPAISWSKQIRAFGIPTILLSATPYRNDFKSFRVMNQFVFNYSYQDAITNHVIRKVKVLPLESPNKTESTSLVGVEEFVESLKAIWPKITQRVMQEGWLEEQKKPKLIIRGDSFESLCLIQSAIDKAFETQSILIHHNASNQSGLNRYVKASEAIRKKPNATIWIHQNKLLEGIDDPSFVAVAIYELMRNGRQIVQQVGRTIRIGKGNRDVEQESWLLAFPPNVKRIQKTWNRYLGYEEYTKESTASIVTKEAAMPERMLAQMPKYQYIEGEFRGRYNYESSLQPNHVQLPKVASILTCDATIDILKVGFSGFEEALLEQDRFQIEAIENMPENAIAFSYYSWRNSPYLVDRFFSEWKLGFFIAVQVGEFLFVHDTEGLSFQPSDFSLTRAERSIMEKAFPNDNATARLSRMSFSSLSMESSALRSTAIHTHSFKETFTDLLDPTLVPLTAAGFVNGTGRYVGFTRSKLRDASTDYVSIPEYVTWVKEIALELSASDVRRSAVFDRYANLVGRMEGPSTNPVSVLLDLSFEEIEKTDIAKISLKSDIDYIDLCSEVDSAGNFAVEIGGESIQCHISFNEKKQRYKIVSDRLNELFLHKSVDGKKATTLLQRLNAAQSFRVLINHDKIVYSEGRFFEPRIQWVLEDGTKPILKHIEESPCLKPVVSEKGEAFYDTTNPTDWMEKSVFGIFKNVCLNGITSSNDPLQDAIHSIPVWICDDDTKEIADFIGIDEDNKKLVYVHAKVGKVSEGGSGYNVNALQDVGRQALASLAFAFLGQPSDTWTTDRWSQEVQANKKTLKRCGRVFKNNGSMTNQEVDELLKRSVRDLSYEKELWIVGARMIDLDKIKSALEKTELDNRLRQLLMHWHAMGTACARANVSLKWFC